jgi:dolichol-phosphate mannosyltransferase
MSSMENTLGDNTLLLGSTKQPHVSIIIPTYNEKDNVLVLIDTIRHVFRDTEYEVIFVDDSSPDGTAETIFNLSLKYPFLRLVSRPAKLGLGSAVISGMRHALADSLIVMDADLQHPPEILPKILSKLVDGFDLVIASRKTEGGSIVGWNWRRQIVSEFATFLAHLIVPKTRVVKDPLSGFFGFKKSVLRDVPLTSTGYKILLEIIVKGKYRSVSELPFTFIDRKSGQSKLGIQEYISFISLIIKLRRYTNRKTVDTVSRNEFELINYGNLNR